MSDCERCRALGAELCQVCADAILERVRENQALVVEAAADYAAAREYGLARQRRRTALQAIPSQRP